MSYYLSTVKCPCGEVIEAYAVYEQPKPLPDLHFKIVDAAGQEQPVSHCPTCGCPLNRMWYSKRAIPEV